jgi:hypothetical protein
MPTNVDEMAEGIFRLSTFAPEIGPTGFMAERDPLEAFHELAPTTLALMHGSSFSGDCAGALAALADEYEARLARA